ncbi:MAG: ATP-binding cassette domain-containing protein [Dehalococcoidia bacterium]
MAGAGVSVQRVSRLFRLGAEEVWALREVNLTVAPGEFVALIGRSGSGKTTLLNIIAGLDRPTEGDVLIDGRSVPAMSERDLIALRRGTLGFVFQSFGLLPLLSAYENVELPLASPACATVSEGGAPAACWEERGWAGARAA